MGNEGELVIVVQLPEWNDSRRLPCTPQFITKMTFACFKNHGFASQQLRPDCLACLFIYHGSYAPVPAGGEPDPANGWHAA